MSAQDFRFCGARLGQSRLGGDGDEGIQRGVELFDLGQAVLRQLNGRQLSLTQQLGGFYDRCEHGPSSLWQPSGTNYRLMSLSHRSKSL